MTKTAPVSEKSTSQTKPKKQTKSKKHVIDFSVANLSENDLYQYSSKILEILLRDRTTSFYSKRKKNIIWANDNYADYGKKYGATCQITPD